jgi:hypothetical protein
MTADRILHLLRSPVASPAATHRRGPLRPQRVGLPSGKRRVAVACSSSTEEDGMTDKDAGVDIDAGTEEDGMTYKDAGVDIDAGTELVRRIRKMAPWIGGFGGLLAYSMILSSLLTLSLNSAAFCLERAFDVLCTSYVRTYFDKFSLDRGSCSCWNKSCC